MKLNIAVVSVLLLGALAALAGSMDQSPLYKSTPTLVAQQTRSGVLVSGGGTAIDCSNAAGASSAELSTWARYYVMCTDASYLRRGSTSTIAAAAAVGDLILPANTWLDIPTDGDAFYLGCKNVNTDAACYYQEVR